MRHLPSGRAFYTIDRTRRRRSSRSSTRRSFGSALIEPLGIAHQDGKLIAKKDSGISLAGYVGSLVDLDVSWPDRWTGGIFGNVDCHNIIFSSCPTPFPLLGVHCGLIAW